MLVPNSPSLPCTQLRPLPSCPPLSPTKATSRLILVTVWAGGSLSSWGGWAGCHFRTSEDLMDLLDIWGGGAPEAWAPCGKRFLVGSSWGHSLPPPHHRLTHSEVW